MPKVSRPAGPTPKEGSASRKKAAIIRTPTGRRIVTRLSMGIQLTKLALRLNFYCYSNFCFVPGHFLLNIFTYYIISLNVFFFWFCVNSHALESSVFKQVFEDYFD